jgi:hypothetical protein
MHLPARQDDPKTSKEEIMPEPVCVNLREMFGECFKITYDESFDPRGKHKHNLDPWAMQLPCEGKGVTIYPHGGTRLAVEINYRLPLARKVAALEGVELYQDGDWEKTFLFDIALFEQVAALVKPRRRKHLTEEQRQQALANLTPGSHGPRSSLDKSHGKGGYSRG